MSEPTVSVYESEERTFPPSDAFKATALTSDRSLYDEADADFETFWARQARELLTWDCLLYTSPSPRDLSTSRMPSSA